MTTISIMAGLAWFTAGMTVIAVPTIIGFFIDMRRKERAQARKPADPEEMRQVAADLARLSRTIARMAETEETAPQEEARASA